MAVKTSFTADEFVQILSTYALGEFRGAEPIGQGSVQTNYTLWTTQGKYVFRYYENRSVESVLFECDLLSHLARRHFPCAPLVRNRLGEGAGVYRGKPYVIFGFLAGELHQKPELRHMAQLVETAATLQHLTQDFCSPYTRYRWNYTPALCLQLARQEATRLGTQDAHDKVRWLVSELATLELPASLPKAICHCDFHFSNVLFQGDRLVALLDFDDANYTYLPFDLVGLIESWAWPYPADRLDTERARTIVEIYTSTRKLSPSEEKHLYDVYRLSILFDAVWYLGRGSHADFYEKTKIDSLYALGRQRFAAELFGARPISQ